jgi:hypothetical protein
VEILAGWTWLVMITAYCLQIFNPSLISLSTYYCPMSYGIFSQRMVLTNACVLDSKTYYVWLLHIIRQSHMESCHSSKGRSVGRSVIREWDRASTSHLFRFRNTSSFIFIFWLEVVNFIRALFKYRFSSNLTLVRKFQNTLSSPSVMEWRKSLTAVS